MREKNKEKKNLVQIGFLKGETTTWLINYCYHFPPNLRAKQRKDVRYEETRGDWYFDRKHLRETHEEKTHCSSKDKDCHEKSKGERYMRRDKGKSDKMKSKGENKRFHEKVQYQERHFKENLRKRSSVGY